MVPFRRFSEATKGPWGPGPTNLTPKANVAEGASGASTPTREELWTLFVHSAVPMVGFGIMDNLVMIQAGDLIDNTIG